MSTRTEQAEAKAAAITARMTIRQLIEAYDLAGAAQADLIKDRIASGSPAVVLSVSRTVRDRYQADYSLLAATRGWMQDELERRDPAAFNAWFDSDEFSGSPARFFLCQPDDTDRAGYCTTHQKRCFLHSSQAGAV